MVNMGERLRTLRMENQLTQTQVAKRIGVAVSAVSSYEAGTRYPSYSVLIKFSRLFHVSCDYLLGVKGEELLDISDLSENDKEVLRTMAAALRAKHKK